MKFWVFVIWQNNKIFFFSLWPDHGTIHTKQEHFKEHQKASCVKIHDWKINVQFLFFLHTFHDRIITKQLNVCRVIFMAKIWIRQIMKMLLFHNLINNLKLTLSPTLDRQSPTTRFVYKIFNVLITVLCCQMTI